MQRSEAAITCRGTGKVNVWLLITKLKACKESQKNLEQVKQIHAEAVESRQDSNTYLANSLISMYSKCGSMLDARYVFDSLTHPTVVSWNVLVLGYVENGQASIALDLFRRMRTEGLAPDSVSFMAALRACAFIKQADQCKQIHNLAVENRKDSDMFLQNALIDMYAKCSSIVDARAVFDVMKHPDLVSWTALIQGYVDNGQAFIALDIYTNMRRQGPTANSVTFMASLKACGVVGGLEFGRTIHSDLDMDKRNYRNVALINCLVDFYAKCGSMVEAQNVFKLHAETRNMVTWTSLLAGFSNCGDHVSMFQLFGEMQDKGFQPDRVTFLYILMCCSHVGLLDKGKECFDAMFSKYGVIPTLEHYTCMVDIFGRGNKLDEGMALLECMRCNPDDVTWMAVLGACRKWKNVNVGKLAFQSLINSDNDVAGYVLMRQIYRSRGMFQEPEEMARKLRRKPGETCWTSETGEVHVFLGFNFY